MGRKRKQLSDEALVVAYRIREARSNKFNTIKDAAESLPVEKTLWGNWENASAEPQKATMERIAALLGVSVEYFYEKPENWEAVKPQFIADLITRTRVKKEYYESFNATLREASTESRTPPKAKPAPNDSDFLEVFFQMTKLITDAQTKVIEGKIAQETYDTHMQTIADMIKVSLFMRK